MKRGTYIFILFLITLGVSGCVHSPRTGLAPIVAVEQSKQFVPSAIDQHLLALAITDACQRFIVPPWDMGKVEILVKSDKFPFAVNDIRFVMRRELLKKGISTSYDSGQPATQLVVNPLVYGIDVHKANCILEWKLVRSAEVVLDVAITSVATGRVLNLQKLKGNSYLAETWYLGIFGPFQKEGLGSFHPDLMQEVKSDPRSSQASGY